MCSPHSANASAFGCGHEGRTRMNAHDPQDDGNDGGEGDEAIVNRIALPTLETPTLTKAELAELLFERLGLNKRESKDMVEAFFDLIHATLVSGADVKMSGFGNFNIRRKAPRPGRNPRTGEAIPIKARNVVTFHASHKLKGVVQGDIPPEDEFE
jgi:integration host factor subunit alpha